MNELDLAVLKHASSHGFHSVKHVLDANDAITLTITSPAQKTTMTSVIRVDKEVEGCRFSFSEEELVGGDKVYRTSHTFYCETLTDVIQIIDKFRQQLRAAYIDPDAIKQHIVAAKTRLGRLDEAVANNLQAPVWRDLSAPTPPPAPPAHVWDSVPKWPTAKKEGEPPFNTDLDEEDKT